MKENKKMVLLGQEVNVTNWIPYARKIEAAKEYVATAYSFYEDAGVVCLNHMDTAVVLMIQLKYYTDMDVSKYVSEEDLCDLMDAADENRGAIDEFCAFIREDSNVIFYDIAEKIEWATEKIYEQEHSIGHKIMKSFGFLFDGKDIAQTLAEGREVSEQMVDHLGAIAKAKDILAANAKEPVDLSEFAKRKKD